MIIPDQKLVIKLLLIKPTSELEFYNFFTDITSVQHRGIRAGFPHGGGHNEVVDIWYSKIDLPINKDIKNLGQ